LLLAVFEYLESGAIQISDHPLALVHNGGMDNDFLHLLFYDEIPTLLGYRGGGLLLRGSRRKYRAGLLHGRLIRRGILLRLGSCGKEEKTQKKC
jgi:hypothetical protein